MLISEIPVIAIDYQPNPPPSHNTQGEGEKDKKLLGDYLVDVYTSSL